MKYIKKNLLFILTLLSIIIGIILGIIFKEKILIIKPLGELFLNMLYTIVVPLVFLSVCSSAANMKSLKSVSKILKTSLKVFVSTSLISAIFMLFILLIFNPVSNGIILENIEVEKTTFLSTIVNAISVNDFNDLLSRNHILPIIIFALFLGIGINVVEKDENKVISESLVKLTKVMMLLIKWIMYYAPIGLMAYFASLVGEYGPEIMGSYAKCILIYYLACILYFLIFYTIYAYKAGGKEGILKFYKNIFPSVLVSFGTQSSLATLPSNVNAAKKMKIDKEVSDFVLPLGSTMHMEGSSMSTVLKIFFLLGLFSSSISAFSFIISILVLSVLCGALMAGIPGGGMVIELLIVSVYNFPSSAFMIISTIAWLIDPPATVINAVGDVTSLMLIDSELKKE